MRSLLLLCSHNQDVIVVAVVAVVVVILVVVSLVYDLTQFVLLCLLLFILYEGFYYVRQII